MITPNSYIFIDAIDKGEEAKFLVGEPPYFVEAKNDNEEPQNVNDAFNLIIFAAWEEFRDPRIPESFLGGLEELLRAYPDPNKAIYVVCDWVWFYRYCLNDKANNPNSAYKSLFEVDLRGIALLLREMLEKNKLSLEQDRRWAGAEWNSQNGLWSPLLRQAVAVKDSLGGPDFVPRILLPDYP